MKTTKTTKTDNSRRTVYIMDGLFQDFQDYQAIQMSLMQQYPGYNPDGYVFCQENGQPYEPRTYQDLFKRCVRQAGIADTNFHACRHPNVKPRTQTFSSFFEIFQGRTLRSYLGRFLIVQVSYGA